SLAAAHLDDPRIERERRLRRRAAVERAALVTAGLDLAGAALHAVDELAVEVANFGGKLSLPEVEGIGRRRVVVRKVEDADGDRGTAHASLLEAAKTVDLDRHRELGVRPQ